MGFIKARKRIIRYTLVSLLVLTIISVTFFTTVDWRPYNQLPYYFKTKNLIKNIHTDSTTGNYLKVGWAKENISPLKSAPLAGYGIRNNFKGIHDSLWVKTFVFDNGKATAAIVTVDLLIFPPAITQAIKSRLPPGFSLSNVLFSATHTHSGAGGWAEAVGGKLIAGNYDSVYVEKIIRAVLKSINDASNNLEESSVGFAQYNAVEFIKNRLVKGGKVDPWIRVLKFRKKSGATALITTFAAHATSLSSKEDYISRDYPGALVDFLERSKKIDFAAYCAGAVGSQAPIEHFRNNYKLIELMARGLSRKILTNQENIPLIKTKYLKSFSLPLYLREPHFKVSENVRFRPWVFNLVFGAYPSQITALRIGDQVIMGTPCDFSGALMPSFTKISQQKKVNLIVTSFNGGYIGYITEDRYYNLPKSETREMNWYGPYNGEYFVELMQGILQKI